ncbi:MAG: hypothetical protein ACAF41_00955 (plasmid) [Leptolyngbya sp. BL-A-14]
MALLLRSSGCNPDAVVGALRGAQKCRAIAQLAVLAQLDIG